MSKVKHSNWLPIGIIGILLGIVFIFAGSYAYYYIEWLDSWHQYDSMWIRDCRYPYRDWAFPIWLTALSLIIIGIVGIVYDYTLTRRKEGVEG